MPKFPSAILRRVAASLVIIVIAGCASAPSQDRVSWNRTANAALDAVKYPSVWIPLAGAAVLQVDNWDHDVSTWAVEHTPVFGSTKNASRATDDLQIIAGVGTLASWLALPSQDDSNSKLRQGVVELGAIAGASLTTESLKAVVSRPRPNGHGDSFPSGHATFVAVANTLTLRNLDELSLSSTSQTAFTIGANVFNAATAWGRVEAGAHYPSDVLVGMAIGNFFGRWFSGAFLGDQISSRLSISIQPTMKDGAQLTWDWRF